MGMMKGLIFVLCRIHTPSCGLYLCIKHSMIRLPMRRKYSYKNPRYPQHKTSNPKVDQYQRLLAGTSAHQNEVLKINLKTPTIGHKGVANILQGYKPPNKIRHNRLGD